jgi:chemotaxis protein CheC
VTDVTSKRSATDLTRVWDLSQRSMRRAGESLTLFLGHPVRLAVLDILALPASDLPSLAEENAGGPMAALQCEIVGPAIGSILILFPQSTISRFLRALLGMSAEGRPLTPVEESAILEVGNILSSSFLSEMGDRIGRRLMHSPPEIHFTNIPRLVRELLSSLHLLGSEVLVVQGILEDPERHIQGRFFVVPEIATQDPIVPGAARDSEDTK